MHHGRLRGRRGPVARCPAARASPRSRRVARRLARRRAAPPGVRSDTEAVALAWATDAQRAGRRHCSRGARRALARALGARAERRCRSRHRAYPALLARLADAPAVLWVRGEPAALGAPAVAIVGSRAASPGGLAGRATARRRPRRRPASIVVSGLARGVDAAAHEGALAAGRTVAVLGSGADSIYPRRARRHWPRASAAPGRSSRSSRRAPPPRRHHFPAAQPHHQRALPGGRRRRGGRAQRRAHHRADGPRPGARGDGGARAGRRRTQPRAPTPSSGTARCWSRSAEDVLAALRACCRGPTAAASPPGTARRRDPGRAGAGRGRSSSTRWRARPA